MKTLISAIVILISGSTFAAELKNGYCFGYKNIQFVGLREHAGELSQLSKERQFTCDDFDQFDDLGGKINELAGFSNPDTDLMVIKSELDASDSFAFDHLSIGYDRTSATNLKHVKPIFVHEWAHALLNQYLIDNARIMEPLRPLRQKDIENFGIIASYFKLLDVDGKCKSNECLMFASTIQKENTVDEMAVQINAFWNAPEVKNFAEISAHYHELFADFVTVLYFEDPNIVRNSLVYFASASRSSDCRSFTFSAPAGYSELEPHCSLSEVRSQLYMKMTEAKTIAQKRQLIQNFLNIIISEVESQSLRNIQIFPDAEAKRKLSLAIEAL